MKIVGFVKFWNEEKNGNLERCLGCLDRICNHIVCADDGSTDNSLEIAKKYTDNIVKFEKPDLTKELERKQKLLEKALELEPDWILWLDGDECLEKRSVEAIRKLCKFGDTFNIDGFAFHLVNLWRSKCWYRLDNKFNELWKIHLWRNNGRLKFLTKQGLHKPQHPTGIVGVRPCNIQNIHYGFSTTDLVIDKYKMYRKYGQKGWALQRLKDESEMVLKPANLNWFFEKPDLVPKPEPLTEERWDELCE